MSPAKRKSSSKSGDRSSRQSVDINGRGMHTRMRYILVSTIILLMAACVMSSAFKTTVVHADKWNAKANAELQQTEDIPPLRGDILAADGSVLATNLTYYNAYIDFKASKFMEKELREDLTALADTLADHYPQYTGRQWRDRLSAELNKAPKDRKSSFLLLRNLSFAQAEQLKDFPFFKRSKNRNRTGLVTNSHMMRKYPYGDMARRSIGFVGQTADNSEIHGRAGLEYALDKLLYGRPGKAKKVPLTHKIANWTDVPPQHGYSLTTTIDIAMQDIVETELNNMLDSMQAEWGTVILMHVPTGDIKAISNLERDSTGRYIEAQNYALQAYEPGSVMKVVSMTVALEDGFVKDINEMYHIPGSMVYGGGDAISDSHSPSELPVSKFLCYSSNIGMCKLVAPHYEHDLNGFRERLRKMGFLDTLHTGIAGERPPYFPTLDPSRGGKCSLGRQTFGYAAMIPPLYTCAFYNAIANDGKFVRPRIVSKITTERGDSVLPVTYVRQQMCSPKTAQTIRTMLHDVVYAKGGTARMLANDYVELIGKTGTARIGHVARKDSVDKDGKPKAGGYSRRYRFAFCGMFPYDKPQYTCMVLVSNPGPTFRNAGQTSGWIMRNIALKMYSRGMLGTGADYHDGQPAKGALPTVYASNSSGRLSDLKDMLGTGSVQRIASPAATRNGVPDVRGLNVRDAVMTLERAGYNVSVTGAGYVARQSVEPGQSVKPGTKVKLTLRGASR